MSSRAVLEKCVNESGLVDFTMSIPTLAMWEPWLIHLETTATVISYVLLVVSIFHTQL